MDLLERFETHLDQAGLFAVRPARAVLAVSGGSDSMALLHLMTLAAPRVGLTLNVVHIDHGILPESGVVAERVVSAARALEVPVSVMRLGLGSGATETAAREARYRALRQRVAEIGARYLVTAHHAGDQAETILFRFLRGSGMAGLSGMLAERPDGLVRPLLPFSKSELVAWLASRSAGALHHDPSNLDRRHDRVWVRHDLLPQVERRMGAAAIRNILEIGNHARRDREAWRAVLDHLPDLEYRREGGGVTLAVGRLGEYHNSLSQAVLRTAALDVGCPLGPARAAALLAFVTSAPSGKVFEIGAGWRAEVAFGEVRILPAPVPPPVDPVQWGGTGSGCIAWGRWRIRWGDDLAGELTRAGWTTWVTPGSGLLRPVRGGDRMKPLGGAGRRKVSKVLIDHKVARSRRAEMPLVVRNDTILWIPGVCRSDDARPDPGTKAVRLDASFGSD